MPGAAARRLMIMTMPPGQQVTVAMASADVALSRTTSTGAHVLKQQVAMALGKMPLSIAFRRAQQAFGGDAATGPKAGRRYYACAAMSRDARQAADYYRRCRRCLQARAVTSGVAL